MALNQETFDQLWEIFQELGVTAPTLNHYDLSKVTSVNNPTLWKEFLSEPAVEDWVRSEINLIQSSELNKLIKGISGSRSVGQAQVMNALSKLNAGESRKEGPIFIYSYVPLSPEQVQAENVVLLKEDPFERREG